MSAQRAETRVGERGSGGVLALSLAGATAVVLAVSLPLYMGIALKHSVAGAADAAALAAADTVSGFAHGDACATAARVADVNGAYVSSCELDGAVVTVGAARDVLGVTVIAFATAGPNHGEAD